MVTARKKSPPGNGDSKGGFRAANNISPVSNLSCSLFTASRRFCEFKQEARSFMAWVFKKRFCLNFPAPQHGVLTYGGDSSEL